MKEKKIIADGIRLSCIMMCAELDGIVCSGARSGKQFTYALLEERVPYFKPIKEDEALAELTKRYFNSRGPATLKDFAVWSGLTNAQVKKGIAMGASDLIQEKIGNEIYYFPPTTLLHKKQIQQAFLLPPYDEYIMGYKNRDAIFLTKNKIKPAPALLFDNTIIIAGQVVGSWRRTIQKDFIELEYHLFDPAHRNHISLIKQAVGRLSKFMGLRVLIKN